MASRTPNQTETVGLFFIFPENKLFKVSNQVKLPDARQIRKFFAIVN